MIRFYRFFAITIVLFASHVAAQEPIKIGIIIDDLGNNLQYGQELIELPFQLTYSFLPNRPFTPRLAKMAASAGKEVMVHLPMQSSTTLALGDGALTLELTQYQFQKVAHASIESVPFARGVNNHMGSLLTRHPGHMAWLMEVISKQENGFYFVDSKTTANTIAGQVAREHLVPNISRDVFIDNTFDENEIWKQLGRLTRMARNKGYALGIGHPHPTTIKILSDYLPALVKQGIEVVPITTLIELNPENSWPKYSSLSRPVVKN